MYTYIIRYLERFVRATRDILVTLTQENACNNSRTKYTSTRERNRRYTSHEIQELADGHIGVFCYRIITSIMLYFDDLNTFLIGLFVIFNKRPH